MQTEWRTLIEEAVAEYKVNLMELSPINYEEEMHQIANTKNAHVLEKLSWDEDDTVRLMVAKNTNTPVETLRRLVDDLDDQVSATASDTLETIMYGTTEEEAE